MTLTLAQLEQADLAGGWPASLVPQFASLQEAESSGNPLAIGPGGSWGTPQIQPQDWPQFAPTSDPVQQAKDALQIFQKQGWGAWSTYGGSTAQGWLSQAQQTLSGLIGQVPGLASPPATSGLPTPTLGTVGQGLAGAATASVQNVGIWARNNIVALIVALVVAVALFGDGGKQVGS